MNEEIVTKPVVEELESDETVETPETKLTPEKVFKQEEVDTLIKNRIRREKETTKKLLDQMTQESETQMTEYKSQITSYEKVFSPMVENMMKGQSDAVKRLLSKLPLLEQFEFLSDPDNQVAKRNIPTTPKSEEEVKPQQKKSKIII